MPKTYEIIDLFAGCGGMTYGFEKTERFRSISAVEWDEDAAETYAMNFETQVEVSAIEDVGTFDNADVLVGGPPCQGFSSLNRRGATTESRSLWREYLRALAEADPAVFVMENVPELLKSEEYADFKDQAEILGYRVAEDILNAADFGVAQRRRRAIVIGTALNEPIPWPAATHFSPKEVEVDPGRTPWVSFGKAVHGLSQTPNNKRWHRARNPWPESVIRYKAVPPGGNRFDMQRRLDRDGLSDLVPRCWREKPTGTTDVFGRLWWDRPSVTIRTEFFKPEKGRYLHPTEDRPITVREAARLMSFPDNFVFPEDQSMTSVARQIGNAVPPLLAQKIAEALAISLDSVPKPLGPRESANRRVLLRH